MRDCGASLSFVAKTHCLLTSSASILYLICFVFSSAFAAALAAPAMSAVILENVESKNTSDWTNAFGGASVTTSLNTAASFALKWCGGSKRDGVRQR